MAREDDFTIKNYLSDIQRDLRSMDEKWEATFENQISQREVLKQTSTTLSNLTSVITMDTPERPSLINHVRELSKGVNEIKTSLNEANKRITDLDSTITKNHKEFAEFKSGVHKTPKEVRVEQWKIVGSLLALVVGAIIAYVTTN